MVGDRREGESARAYAAYLAYRDMPQTRRTLTAAAQQFYAGTKVSGPGGKRTFERWSARWGWQQRIAEWQDHVAAEQRTAEVEAHRQMGERHAKLARALQGKALERLQHLDPQELSASELLRFLVEAVKVERVAVGLPADHTQLDLTQPDYDAMRTVAARIDDDPHARQMARELLRIASGGEE